MTEPTIFIKIGEDEVDQSTLTLPADRRFRDAWELDGLVVEIDPVLGAPILKGYIADAMNARLDTGIIWKLNNGSAANPVILHDHMQRFLRDANALRQRGRANPHNGEVWAEGGKFTINDAGLDELVEFAGAWGFKISQIARQQDEAVDLMTGAQMEAFDPEVIDWTVTWVAPDTNNGWTDDIVVQNP